MRNRWPILLLLLLARLTFAQTNTLAPPFPTRYRLNVSVVEVILTFHAADARGLPVNDLKLTDLTLLDNGHPPARILDFQLQQNFPIRAGILIDTSGSMSAHLFRNQSIATQYAQQLLRQQTDQAFVTDFDRVSRLIQPWTGNPSALANLAHDGAFHPIVLETPDRVATLTIRSGYYAPAPPHKNH